MRAVAVAALRAGDGNGLRCAHDHLRHEQHHAAPPTGFAQLAPLRSQRRQRHVLPLLGLLLLAAAVVLELLLPPSPLRAVEAVLVQQPSVSANINVLYMPAFTNALLAYQVSVPTYNRLTLTPGASPAAGLAAALQGTYDFVVTTTSIPPAQAVSLASMRAYPIMVNAFAPFYSFPPAANGATMERLILSMLGMCQILRGNITMWNDPRLQDINPALPLPAQEIKVVMLGFPTDGGLAMSRLCTKVDAEWAVLPGLGVTPFPNYAAYIPASRLTLTAAVQGPGGHASLLLDTPYAFGMNSQTMVASINVQNAMLINQAGRAVLPTRDTVQQSFLELAGKGLVEGGSGLDLTNSQGTFAWPIVMNGWLWLESDKTQSTCASKKSTLEFLLWVYTSDVVAQAGDAAFTHLLPQLYLTQSGLLRKIRAEITCSGTAMMASDTSSASLQGSAILQSFLTFLLQMYSGVDGDLSYAFARAEENLALQRLSSNEIDVASVSTAALTDEQIDTFLADVPTINGVPLASLPVRLDELGNVLPPQGEVVLAQGGMIVPAFLGAVVATHNLPAEITALYATWSTVNTLGGLPELYPLQITPDMLARTFTAGMLSWLDTEFVALNPQLIPWFNRTGANPFLRTVVCCSDLTDPAVATTVFTRAMLRTRYINDTYGASSSLKYEMPVVNLFPLLGIPGFVQTMIDREARLPAKLAMSPGFMSYRMLASGSTNPTTDFLIATDSGTVAASVESIKACVAPLVSSKEKLAEIFSPKGSRYWSGEMTRKNALGCYPMTSALSFALPRAYTNAAVTAAAASSATSVQAAELQVMGSCSRARKNLQLVAWMQTAPALATVASSSGLVRLSDFEPIRVAVMSALNSATCDGETILITLPYYWSMPTAATSAAIAAATVLLLLCVITAVALFQYRHLPAIRGASPVFLGVVIGGLVLSSIGWLAWTSSDVSTATCLVFQWFSSLGFSLVFAPLFAKTWRIWQIFSANKIRIVKISNKKLGVVVGAIVGFDAILLVVWSAVSPLQPVLFVQEPLVSDGAEERITLCAPLGSAGLAMLGVVAAYKGGLLVFGAVMGFTTRKVTQHYNEASSIAWSVYNAVFVSLIVAALLASLVDALGDTTVFLVLFLLVWVMLATWGLVFLPKAPAIWAAVQGQQGKGEPVPDLPTSGTNTSGAGGSNFSFASVMGMSAEKLNAYAKALEAQLDRVKRRIHTVTGQPYQPLATGPGGASKGPGSGGIDSATANRENRTGSETGVVTGYGVRMSPMSGAVRPSSNAVAYREHLAGSNGIGGGGGGWVGQTGEQGSIYAVRARSPSAEDLPGSPSASPTSMRFNSGGGGGGGGGGPNASPAGGPLAFMRSNTNSTMGNGARRPSFQQLSPQLQPQQQHLPGQVKVHAPRERQRASSVTSSPQAPEASPTLVAVTEAGSGGSNSRAESPEQEQGAAMIGDEPQRLRLHASISDESAVDNPSGNSPADPATGAGAGNANGNSTGNGSERNSAEDGVVAVLLAAGASAAAAAGSSSSRKFSTSGAAGTTARAGHERGPSSDDLLRVSQAAKPSSRSKPQAS